MKYLQVTRRALPGLVAVLLGACAVGPDYRAPQPAPALIANARAVQFTAASPEAAWWHEFGDPELDGLVTHALGANLDLAAAAARVRAARAVLVENRFDLAPHVPLTAGYSKADQQQPRQHGRDRCRALGMGVLSALIIGAIAGVELRGNRRGGV